MVSLCLSSAEMPYCCLTLITVLLARAAVHFPGNDVKQPLAVLDKGEGSLDGLRAHLTKDKAVFALTRVVSPSYVLVLVLSKRS